MSDWACERCKSINREAAITCYKCGSARGAVPVHVPGHDAPAAAGDGMGGSAADTMGTEAAAAVASPMAAEAAAAVASADPVVPAGPGNLVGGLLGGLVGGALGTAIWFGVVALTEYQVGLIAIGVGWLVGTGVVIGAGRRGSFALLPISAVITLVALVVSEWLLNFHFAAQQLDLEGIQIDVIQPLDFMIEVVVDSVQADPLTILFWGLALFAAVSVPWKLSRPAS